MPLGPLDVLVFLQVCVLDSRNMNVVPDLHLGSVHLDVGRVAQKDGSAGSILQMSVTLAIILVVKSSSGLFSGQKKTHTFCSNLQKESHVSASETSLIGNAMLEYILATWRAYDQGQHIREDRGVWPPSSLCRICLKYRKHFDSQNITRWAYTGQNSGWDR